MLARLKPFNPRRGHTLRSWSAPGMPVFKVERGWYEVTDDQADTLSAVTQNPDSPESPYAFDIVKDAAAAAAIEKQEKRAATPDRGDPEAPVRVHAITRGQASAAASRVEGVMTTADLPANQKADTTDALPGDESDLDKDDLADAPPARPAPSTVPGAPGSAARPSRRPPGR